MDTNTEANLECTMDLVGLAGHAQTPVVDDVDTVQYAEEGQSRPGCRKKKLILLALLLSLQVIISSILQSHQAALVSMNNFLAMMQLMADGHVLRIGSRSVWRLPRSGIFLDQSLLHAHSEYEFTRRFRVKRTTFYYICGLVAPTMTKSKIGGGISLENRVAVSLARLGTGNYLLACADQYGMAESTACIAVRDFCAAVKKFIRPIVIPKYSKEAVKHIAAKFEAKHGIPFIMGAIDGSHIPIIAPIGDPAPFYNRKGFYSALLQGVVDMDTIFWDWDFGWAGSLHDYTLFINSKMGIDTIAGTYLPYKLIGDAAYPARTCMYVPFKGTKEQLEASKAHWNFIQSSTRMCVERAFGILKQRWRILLRRLEVNLVNTADVVGACICLHNLCVMHKDFVDENMLEEAHRWLVKQHSSAFSELHQLGTMKIFEYSKAELGRCSGNNEEQSTSIGEIPEDDTFKEPPAGDKNTMLELKNGVTMHTQLAKYLYRRHLCEQCPLPTGFYEEDPDADKEGGVPTDKF